MSQTLSLVGMDILTLFSYLIKLYIFLTTVSVLTIFIVNKAKQKHVMKKNIIAIAIALLIPTALLSQEYFLQEISFTTQTEIDSFQVNYPGCSLIEGNVTISGNDITNFEGLKVITSIGGYLLIHDNSSLTNLNGLQNLKYVRDLAIIDNDILINLTGLEGLDNINGILQIWYNDALINLSGLDNISYIATDLQIEGNYSLLNLDGLENLTYVGGNLIVGCVIGWAHYHRSLKSLSGLNNLGSIGGYLWINCNDSLTNLSGLENLVNIGNGLIINGNKSLKNLSGLERLRNIGGFLIIGGGGDCDGNPLLTNLDGIKNIDPESISKLYIRDNASLSTCNIESICNYLKSPTAEVDIQNNAPGCSSHEEVGAACSEADIAAKENKLKPLYYPNPVSHKLYFNEEVQEITIFTLSGQMVRHKIQTSSIDVSNLNKGIYTIELVTGAGKKRDKLVVL